MSPQLTNETILRQAIKKLIASREAPGYWVDYEKEEPIETMVYKGTQALSTLLLVKKTFPQLLGDFNISGVFIQEEVNYMFNCVKKEGFFPSPYSYVRDLFDSIDFAAVCSIVLIDILLLIRKRYFDSSNFDLPSVRDQCYWLINNSLKLIEQAAYTDKNGTRWEGCFDPNRKRPQFPNVYFTASAIKALGNALDSYELQLDVDKKDNYLKLLQQGILWILSREKGGILSGDEGKTKTEVNHAVYALLAITEVWKYLDLSQQETSKKLFSNFINQVNEENLIFQSFMEIAIPGSRKPIYYDDQCGYGHILSALCRGREAMKDAVYNTDELTNIINKFLRSVLDSGNLEKGFWPKDTYYISETCDSIIGLIDYELYGTPVVYSFSEFDILKALNNTLKSNEIRNIFLSELARIQAKKQFDKFRKDTE